MINKILMIYNAIWHSFKVIEKKQEIKTGQPNYVIISLKYKCN